MRKLKWGLIGCGDIARKRVAPALRDLPAGEFVAVSRARVELAEGFAREHGARKWYGNTEDLLADSEVEAVYIATPVDLHCDQVLAAARALPLPSGREVDLAGLTHADSAALAVLLALKRRAAADGAEIAFTSVPDTLLSLARVYGVDALVLGPETAPASSSTHEPGGASGDRP
jgi:ABC-type transporter Mla MlaB component